MSRFKKLSHTFWHCQYHIVWTPKYHLRILEEEVKGRNSCGSKELPEQKYGVHYCGPTSGGALYKSVDSMR